MKNFKQYINENNIDINKIKEECKKLNPNINYSSSNWEEEFVKNICVLSNWNKFFIIKKVSEDFMEYFIKYFKDNDNIWEKISMHQKLSEDFIEKYKNYVDWGWISAYQKLSEDFIKKHKDKINFKLLFDNENITNELILNNINLFIDQDVEYYSFRFNNKEFKDKWNKYKKLFGS